MSQDERTLEEIKSEYGDLETKLSDLIEPESSQSRRPELLSRPKDLAELGRRLKQLGQTIKIKEEEERLKKELEDIKNLIATEKDAELNAMAQEEKNTIEKKIAALVNGQTSRIATEKEGIVMEIRPGAGGDEAALFAGEITRMYIKFAEKSGWKTQLVEDNNTSIGGQKEAIFIIRGGDAYKKLIRKRLCLSCAQNYLPLKKRRKRKRKAKYTKPKSEAETDQIKYAPIISRRTALPTTV